MGIGKERPGPGEAADAEVEIRGRERVVLRIGQLERDIPQPLFRTREAGDLQHLFGDIHADRAALPRGAAGVSR